MPKAKIAAARAAASEMIAHTCVFTLNTPRRMKKTTSGRRPSSAVRASDDPTAVVDGV